ncbi:unnamed protein product, partial [Ectocarpus sp. 13 AM-2016]
LQPQQPPRSSTRLIPAEGPSTTTIFATTATIAGRMVCQ